MDRSSPMPLPEQHLADTNISAIWFPEGEYEHIDQMLELLLV